MRRALGLAIVLSTFACVGSGERSRGNDDPSKAEMSPRSRLAVGHRVHGSAREPGTNSRMQAQVTSGACSSDLTLHGNPGTVVSQPSIAMLFWGEYWSGAGAPERQRYAAAWGTLSTDPAFYTRLAEYSTSAQAIGTGSWSGSTVGDQSLASGALLTEAQIEQELATEIAAGTAASQTTSRIYVVMLPPGVTSQLDQQNNFAGHHSQFTPAGATVPVRYAVITYNTDEGYNDPVISHEISEACTDPDLSTGWFDQNGEEIGDLCRFDYASLDGYTIETIYSMTSCSCVGPTAGTDGGGGDSGTDAAVVVAACTAPAWSPSATYTGGDTVSYSGSQYTASYWNQNAEPDTHSGGAGSGQPWLLPVSCTTTACTPACGGKQCGSDGCGGACGSCGASQSCDASGRCVASCLPSCNLKQCGSDGCGGSCGNCAPGLTCNPNNQCVAPCVPTCSGKQCGGDTCGGSCGTCASGQTCDSSGSCQTSTTPSCSGLAPWSPSQPWYAYAVGEQHIASNGHRYTCKNVAYCIYDPTSAVGSTYGWADDGPC